MTATGRCWECFADTAVESTSGLCDGCRPYLCTCGTMRQFVTCYNCEDGFDGHDCGEDCCCCLHPEDNRVCGICNGKGGWHACPNCQPRAFDD